jgi:hypothetical protein
MEWLESFSEASYLLARFNQPALSGWLRGRLWERWAADTLRTTAWSAQGPGHLCLFGGSSASGYRHEIDGAGSRNHAVILVEAKAYDRKSPTKNDVCLFDRKTFDLYVERVRSGRRGPHWRVLVSATSLDDEARKYCYLYGIIAVEPNLMPLPMLLRVAARPSADEFFSDMLLGEMVRLGELAACSMEKRYVRDGVGALRFDLRAFDRRWLDDLLWLHSTMSTELLDIVDRDRPDHYERRAAELMWRLGLGTQITSTRSDSTKCDSRTSRYNRRVAGAHR